MQADSQQIRALLPHRFPFLMIDRVVEIHPGQKLTALKNISVNEPHFIGHFPNEKVMPGVLIVEAMAQASYLYAHYSQKLSGNKYIYSLQTVDAKFSKPVFPGDQLCIEVVPIRSDGRCTMVRAECFVDGVSAAGAEIGITVTGIS